MTEPLSASERETLERKLKARVELSTVHPLSNREIRHLLALLAAPAPSGAPGWKLPKGYSLVPNSLNGELLFTSPKLGETLSDVYEELIAEVSVPDHKLAELFTTPVPLEKASEDLGSGRMQEHPSRALIDDSLSEDVSLCIACGKQLRPGDLYYPDQSGGEVHAACIGPERESYTLNGEPLKDGDPIPEPYVWEPLSAPSDAGGVVAPTSGETEQ